MAYPDMNRCPQTVEEFQDYFYTLIGQTYGDPAINWEQVMLRAYPWKGQMLTIPRGVGPGIQQQPGAPFFGLTQNLDSSGHPQARCWLPASEPDGNNYYTHCRQYLDNAPSGSGLVWSFYYFTGNDYTPLEPAGGNIEPGPEPPEPTKPTDLEMLQQRVADLEIKMAELYPVAIRNGEPAVLSTEDERHYLNPVNGGGGNVYANATEQDAPNTRMRIWRKPEKG
jgi:hypothetical protein